MQTSIRRLAGAALVALLLSAFVLATPRLQGAAIDLSQPPTLAEPPPEPLPPPQPGELRPQVLTRGQVHEAYANPTPYDPMAGMTVKKAPPPLIQELPPEQKPEGENVRWIPGYWGWDEKKSDYVWISGFW